MSSTVSMAGSDPAPEQTTGYPWWITPTAIHSMMNRCPSWLSRRAQDVYRSGNLAAAADEIKALANRAAIVDNIVNDTAFMATVVTRYGRTDRHQYRIMNGSQGDRCVFVCCENQETHQMVMITVLHYTGERVQAGTLPSRHLMATGPVPRRDRP